MQHSDYESMVEHVLHHGTWKGSRGAKTLSCFNQCVEYDLQERFPLVTTRRLPWKSIVLETLWFISGARSVDILRRHGLRFWDAWADPVSGDVDSPYGYFWRHWGPRDRDQLGGVVRTLRTSPASRRMVITAWDPDNVAASSLPPCHILQVYHTEQADADDHDYRLNLHVTQRSADIAVGVPFNIASYALLMHLIARAASRCGPDEACPARIRPGRLAITFVDAHIYAEAPYDHRVGLLEQVRRAKRFVSNAPQLDITRMPATLEDYARLLETESADDILQRCSLQNYWPDLPITYGVMP